MIVISLMAVNGLPTTIGFLRAHFAFGIVSHVTLVEFLYVDLLNNNLVGTIARDFLLLLGEKGLISLDLGLNKLYGSIPPEGLRTLTRLQSLSLYNNSLTGGRPSEIESLVGLQLLFMGNNYLKGTIPITIGKLGSLQKLDLHDNQMTGSLPLSVCLLQSLTQLYLCSNSFNSFLPTEIGALKLLQERT
jgi:Leucine-rich repeat (LRR) protein